MSWTTSNARCGDATSTSGSTRRSPSAEGVTTTGSPGDVRITDTTIERPVIDNDTFSYFLECGVSNSPDAGLFGAIVTYRVTAG